MTVRGRLPLDAVPLWDTASHLRRWRGFAIESPRLCSGRAKNQPRETYPLSDRREGGPIPNALPLRQKALDVCCDVILVYDHSYIGDRDLTGFVEQVRGRKRVQ